MHTRQGIAWFRPGQTYYDNNSTPEKHGFYNFWAVRHTRSRTAIVLFLALLVCRLIGPVKPVQAQTTQPTDPAETEGTEEISPTPEDLPIEEVITSCGEERGKVVGYVFDSPSLKRPLKFNIYLPPCYDQQREPGYPVLYLLHGQLFTEDQWDDLGVPETADRLIAAGQVRPFIVVMPLEEYSAANPFTTGYENALVNELIPWVDEHLHTCTLRSCRAIGGLSRGAAWSIRLGFAHWQLFSSIGANSLPPFYGTDVNMPRWLRAIPEGKLPRVWIDVGDKDPTIADASKFEELLTKLGVPHEYHVFAGGHDAAYWSSNLETYLRWYARAGTTSVATYRLSKGEKRDIGGFQCTIFGAEERRI